MPELYSSPDTLNNSHDCERFPSKVTISPKSRKYKHFDHPLSSDTRKFDFSTEQKKHRFYPLLGFNISHKRFSYDSNLKKKKQTTKVRPIHFASHSDALYLQAYTKYLEQYYEYYLHKNNLENCILAYRKGIGSNIDHAKSLFSEILQKKDCFCIALDIKSFFDKINHNILYDEIKRLINNSELFGHHYTVWRNITKYSFINKDELIKKLKKEYKKYDPQITEKQIKNKFKKNARICSKKDFISHVRGKQNGLIKKNKNDFGIPQGTPISGLYANIYLKSFDLNVLEYCKRMNGSYRRYSDDIAIVLPTSVSQEHALSEIKVFIKNVLLSIAENKTEKAIFKDGKIHKDSSRPFIQYLGFTFNGKNILIRASTQHRYLRKMRRGIHAKMIAVKMRNKNDLEKTIPAKEIFKREALSRYTHLGKRRNFLNYAYKASKIMDSPEIRKQFKCHMTWFSRAWRKEMKRVFDET